MTNNKHTNSHCIRTNTNTAYAQTQTYMHTTQTRDGKVSGFEFQERLESFLLQGQLTVLTRVLVSVPPNVTAVARKTSWSFCQNIQVAGYVTAKESAVYSITLFEATCVGRISDTVNWCMGAQIAPRRQRFHTAPAVSQPNSAVTTAMDIQNALCTATLTYSESHTTRAQTHRQ